MNDTMYVMGGTYSSLIADFGNPVEPQPPFDSMNYQYIPFGYGTFEPIPTLIPTATPLASPPTESAVYFLVVGAIVIVTCVLIRVWF